VLLARQGRRALLGVRREITSQEPSQIVDAVMKYPAGNEVGRLAARSAKKASTGKPSSDSQAGICGRGSMGK